jgi:hypothetical protein
MAGEMRGQSNHVAPGLPLDRLWAILGRYRDAFRPTSPPPSSSAPPSPSSSSSSSSSG